MVKKNLIANYLGQGWVALMGLAFVPLYIKYLGVEAYGLIGLFAVLNTLLSLLDMGMSPTLSREMARFTGGSRTAESARDLLRSIELIAIAIAVTIVFSVYLGSNWIAVDWLTAESIPIEVVAQAIAIMGAVIASRFVEGIYRSCIIGLQHQLVLNILKSTMATLQGLGAVGILVWVSPTIQAFFLWQGLLSVTTLLLLATVTYSKLPKSNRIARFSVSELKGVWRFAGGMMGITFLAILLTQVDKILLTKLLSLTDYGYYALASAVAGALFMLIGPITQAVYPRLCELHAQNNNERLIEVYHKGAQLVSVFAGSAAIVVIVFSETLLELWTQDSVLAEKTSVLLSLLMLGNLLNGLVHMPYQAQLAHGWTSLGVKVNIVALIVIIPALLLVVPKYGAVGAGWVWVGLNAGYVFIAVHFVYKNILISEKIRWYLNDVILPVGAGACAAVMLDITFQDPKSLIEQFWLLVLASILTLSMAILVVKNIRLMVLSIVQHIFNT